MKQITQLILALDVATIEEAERFVELLYPKIKIFKVGAQLFTAYGPEVIRGIQKKGAEVFLDLKYFDIPHTTANAVRAAVRHKVKMLTLHILGDEEMLKSSVNSAQAEAKDTNSQRPLLIGVTVLTSKETTCEDVITLARIGLDCGLDGVVCSVRELPILKKELKKDFLYVTPGIRPSGVSAGDQKRTATVQEAVKAGSNFLVIGRPILEAKDPLKAAEEILCEIK
jgi:orotidine-5'-phosphate decarboxylase